MQQIDDSLIVYHSCQLSAALFSRFSLLLETLTVIYLAFLVVYSHSSINHLTGGVNCNYLLLMNTIGTHTKPIAHLNQKHASASRSHAVLSIVRNDIYVYYCTNKEHGSSKLQRLVECYWPTSVAVLWRKRLMLQLTGVAIYEENEIIQLSSVKHTCNFKENGMQPPP